MSAQGPPGVRGWTTETEQALLRECATGRLALEIGAYEGASTLAISESAVELHTVDRFGRFEDSPTGVSDLNRLRRHLAQAGRTNVVIHVGRSDQVLPMFRPGGFGFAFIDGSHHYQDARFDLGACLELLAPRGGLLAVHDCGYAQVADAIRDVGLDQGAAVAQADNGRLKVWRL